MVTRVRAVIYDFGGVFSPSPFESLIAYERDLGVPEGSIAELMFGRSYAHGEGDGAPEHDWHRLETGRITFAQWEQGLQERARERFGPDFAVDLLRAFSGGAMTTSWEMVHHVRRVRSRGLGTAILTNNIAEFGDHWRASIPRDLVDVVVDSSQEGVRKPDLEIYRRTADRLGTDPRECVFVDDLDINVDAARALGMVGVHVVDGDVAAAIARIEDLVDGTAA